VLHSATLCTRYSLRINSHFLLRVSTSARALRYIIIYALPVLGRVPIVASLTNLGLQIPRAQGRTRASREHPLTRLVKQDMFVLFRDLHMYRYIIAQSPAVSPASTGDGLRVTCEAYVFTYVPRYVSPDFLDRNNQLRLNPRVRGSHVVGAIVEGPEQVSPMEKPERATKVAILACCLPGQVVDDSTCSHVPKICH
jgi:hypothetical protein